MRPGIVGGVAPLLDGVELGPVGAVQLLEAVHGHPARPRHELQQPRAHLVAEGEDHAPVPLDHDVVGVVVALVHGVGLPVLHVNAANAAHEKLQLTCSNKYRIAQ